MSSHELAEQMAYDSIEPDPDKLNQWGHAITAASIFNARRTKSNDPITQAEDMLPTFGKEKKEQTTEEMIAAAEIATVAFGSKDLRKKKHG